MTDGITTRRYRIEGMDCASCALKIDTAVRKVPGISDVNVSATSGTMTVAYDGTGDPQAVTRAVKRLGYGIAEANGRTPMPEPDRHDAGCSHDHHHHDHDGHHHDHDHGHDHGKAPILEGLHGHDHGGTEGSFWRAPKTLLTIASGIALVVAYLAGWLVPDLGRPAFILAMLVGLVPIARRAFSALVAGMPFTIEMLMTIAAAGAVLIDASEEAAVVVFLFLVGELLEGIAARRARASITELSALVPKTAHLLQSDGATREVPAETLAVGATIRVRPGDRIPGDGVVVGGESAVNEAPVTGESVPVRKVVGDSVYAGTINGDSVLNVRVTAAASDNTIARVVRLVEEAQEAKSPTERFIDRFSRYYTPGVLVVAALVAVVPPLIDGAAWSDWIYKGLAVLLIGCPCALVISTPAAIAASLASGARRGLLMKGGAVLEGLGRITAVALDKTGTLTEGRPQVTDVIGVDRHSEGEVVRLAAALESGSSHPLALAILSRAAADGIVPPPVSGAGAIGGKGVVAIVDGRELFLGSPQTAAERASLPDDLRSRISALNDEGKTVSVLVVGGQVAGAIAMRDEPRSDAAGAIAELRTLGIRPVMLTGDNVRTATAVGKALSIADVRAELLPEDKQRIVGELRDEGLVVAKVGDGINDAPALAAADIGIAMGGGTDVALETADAAILHGRVSDIAELVRLSRRTMANIAQNITIALGLKVVFLVTTVIGITGLWPAILADTGATVLVTLNALRLLGGPRG